MDEELESLRETLQSDTGEQILDELRKQTAALQEFVDAINKIGDMFGTPDGKTVNPMTMIAKGLFGGR